ncbi:hypothetical protein C8R43DRAFT_1125815 [Mycena crocata]|nr:hypothetical protein C8R43DRAFT_1125815 [Mycena crocata]
MKGFKIASCSAYHAEKELTCDFGRPLRAFKLLTDTVSGMRKRQHQERERTVTYQNPNQSGTKQKLHFCLLTSTRPMSTLDLHPRDKLVKLSAPWLSCLTSRLGKSRDADDLHDITEALSFVQKIRCPEDLVESWQLFTCRSAALYFGGNVPMEGLLEQHPQRIDGPSEGQIRSAVDLLVTEGKCASHRPAAFARVRFLPLIAFDWLLWLAAPEKTALPLPQADKPYTPLQKNARVVLVSDWAKDLVECHNRYLTDRTVSLLHSNQVVAADFKAISTSRGNTQSNISAIGRSVRALLTLPAPTEDDREPCEPLTAFQAHLTSA